MFSSNKKKQKKLKFIEFDSIKKILSPDLIRQKTREIVIEANNKLDRIEKGKPRIALIQAPTGSGKTHSIIDEIKKRDLESKVAIAIPTRANVFNLSELTDNLGAEFGTHVGGENGEDKSKNDIGTIYTYGKLFEIIKHDPLLSDYQELILDEADMISFGQEIRFIPYLKWILKARPSLKIILLSATLDIEGFAKIFEVDKRFIFTLEKGRPRPIKSLYISQNQAIDEHLLMPFKASRYLSTTKKLILENVTGNFKPMIQGEAMIVFLPTINGVKRLSQELIADHSNDLEIRALHSRVERKDLEKYINEPIANDKIGVIIATDIIGRGINFGENLRINRVIHSGLVNQRVYNDIICRDILKVAPATTNEITQAMGRAGRHINDKREVFGYCLQPYTALKSSLNKMFTKHDPTLMILSSIVVYNKIKRLDKFVPNTLEEYISAVGLDKKKVTQTLLRLKAIRAITEQNKITKLGLYLANCNIDLDFALLLYYTPNEEYIETCKVMSLIIRSYNLVDYDNQDLFNAFLNKTFRSKGIKSDFDVYKYLINSIKSRSDAESYGINYNVFEDCIYTAKNLAKLKTDNKDYKKPLIVNNLLKFKKIRKTPYGIVYEYTHMASNTTLNIHSSSILYQMQPPMYVFAFNISLIGENYVASDIASVEYDELLNVKDYMIAHEVGDVLKFDPNTLDGEFEKRIVFKGYYQDTVLKKELVKFQGGDLSKKPLIRYAIKNASMEMKNLAKRIEIAYPEYKAYELITNTFEDYVFNNNVKNYNQLKEIALNITNLNINLELLPPDNITIGDNVYPILYIDKMRVIKMDLDYIHTIPDEYEKFYINVSKTNKPAYITLKAGKKSIIKNKMDKELKKSMHTLKNIDLGPINLIREMPKIPEPVEYIKGFYIYPFLHLAYNNHLLIDWSRKKINYHNLLNKINHTIAIYEQNQEAISKIENKELDQLLLQLLIICNNNERDSSYIEKKVILDSLKGNMNNPKIYQLVEEWVRGIELELKYKFRGDKGKEEILKTLKEFSLNYDKKNSDKEIKLYVDDVIIAKAIPKYDYEKKNYKLTIEDLSSKVINSYIPLKYMEISEKK
jgi:HrpA-like RNA helicase